MPTKNYVRMNTNGLLNPLARLLALSLGFENRIWIHRFDVAVHRGSGCPDGHNHRLVLLPSDNSCEYHEALLLRRESKFSPGTRLIMATGTASTAS